MTEMGQRYHDPIETGMRATGEFAKGAYKGVVENAGYVVSGLAITAIGFAAIVLLPEEVLVGLATTGLFIGISALFSHSNDKR